MKRATDADDDECILMTIFQISCCAGWAKEIGMHVVHVYAIYHI